MHLNFNPGHPNFYKGVNVSLTLLMPTFTLSWRKLRHSFKPSGKILNMHYGLAVNSERRGETRRESSIRSTHRASYYSHMGKQNNIIIREILISALWFKEKKVIKFRCRTNIRDEPARSGHDALLWLISPKWLKSRTWHFFITYLLVLKFSNQIFYRD